MNKLNNNTVNFSRNFSEESVFPDKRELIGDGKNNIFNFLMDVFVELGEKTGDKLYLKHILFQFLLNEYLFEQDLKTFLKENGFELYKVFSNFEDLKLNNSKNKKLLSDIKSGKLNIGLLFNGLIPIGIVLAKQLETDKEIKKYLDELRDEFVRKVGNITELKGFNL